METGLIIIAVILAIVGVIGSVAPGLPGPPLSWVALLLMRFTGGTNSDGEILSAKLLIIWLAITVIVSVLDYVIPSIFTKMTGGSKYAGRGAIIGLFLGMFLTPIGMILGSLLGAFIAEIIYARKDILSSISSALGAFIGFIAGTGIKLIAAGWMLYLVIEYI